jgi:hypothetical protein
MWRIATRGLREGGDINAPRRNYRAHFNSFVGYIVAAFDTLQPPNGESLFPLWFCAAVHKRLGMN